MNAGERPRPYTHFWTPPFISGNIIAKPGLDNLEKHVHQPRQPEDDKIAHVQPGAQCNDKQPRALYAKPDQLIVSNGFPISGA